MSQELPNWIPDENRFSLETPPNWWLTKLRDFDRSLVVIPSRQFACYRLAQRRPPNLSIKMVNEALFKESDTKMLASYGLIPVTTIIARPHWDNPLMFNELANRAPWRMGGAKQVIDEIEAREAAQELAKRAATDDHLNYLGKDAWGLYNKKIGVQSHMYIPRRKGAIVRPRTPSFKIK